MRTVKPSLWTGMYDESWKDVATAPATFHPAKFARGLIRRIYQHAVAEGWLKAGSRVVDPFGGVALGALDAMVHGCQWVGVELEPKFQAIGAENIALWNRRWGHAAGWGQAVLLQGDSRNLCAVVGGQAAAVVASPPYSEGLGHGGRPGKAPHDTKGSLAAMEVGYGTTPGQLGALPEGAADSVISSPPYEGSLDAGGGAGRRDVGLLAKWCKDNGRDPNAASRNQVYDGYGATSGQLGSEQGETFWSASAVIVGQCYQILRPGGVAIWVLKDFVRAGKVVPFCAQWRALCEAAGFRFLHEHRAMLVREWTEPDLFAGTVKKEKRRESFFRRLSRKRGAPGIDYEVILCLRKEA
jgi:hypothetical protein